jgi:hypothetical protein
MGSSVSQRRPGPGRRLIAELFIWLLAFLPLFHVKRTRAIVGCLGFVGKGMGCCFCLCITLGPVQC